MNVLRFLEANIFTGEVVRDFGIIHQGRNGLVRETHSLLLCRRRGKLWIVIRHSYRAFLGFSVSYTRIPADMADALAGKFAEISRERKTTLPY